MLRLVAAGLCSLFSLTACIEVYDQRVEVTPGTVPPEIRGAKWPNTPIEYCIVRDGSEGFVDHETLVSLTQQAFAAWGVETQFEGDCGGPIANDNGRNEIGWGDLGKAPDDLTEAGNTNIRYRTSLLGGAPDITEADVTIHREPARGKGNEACLLATLLHETGHVLGLPHLSTESVMSPVITDCLDAPTPEDVRALDELY